MTKTNFSIIERILIKSRQVRFKNTTNSPYLSGDGFASLADLKIQTNNDLEKFKKLQKIPRIIHVRSDLIELLLDIKKVSTEEHILLAGNSDSNLESKNIFKQSIFSKIYLQNSTISDNLNIFTLPIGVENLSIGINGMQSNLKNTSSWAQKKTNVMVGPFSPTHTERMNLLDQISHTNPMVNKFDGVLSPKKFAYLMSEHQYILCPRGNGIDTHRFWEALYRGCVPIILKNKWSSSLNYLNIPMVQLEKWQDFEFEIKKFGKTFSGFDPRKLSFLWIDHWQKLLNPVK